MNLLTKIAIFFIAIVALAVMLNTSLGRQSYQIAGINLKGQQMTNWCWAASTQMVGEYLIRPSTRQLPQKEIVNFKIGALSPDSLLCYVNPYDTILRPYNQTLNVREFSFFENYFDTLGYDCDHKEIRYDSANILWGNMKKELLSNKPFIISGLQCQACNIWNNHIVVAKGFFENELHRWIVINDPWRPQCEGCSYYLNFDAMQRTIAKPGQVNGSLIKLIHNFRKKQPMNLWEQFYEKIDYLINYLKSLGINMNERWQSGQNEVSRRTMRMVNSSNLNTVNYLVQVVDAADSSRNYTYTLRHTEDTTDFYVDANQQKCILKAAIPAVIQNTSLFIDDKSGNIEITFSFGQERFTMDLDQFNELISEPKSINKNNTYSTKPIIL